MTTRWSLVFVVLAGLGVVGPAHATGTAGACPTAGGVTVVVDASAAGGSVVVGCATGSPGSGFDALRGAGFSVDVVQSQPGFVCRIDGRPEGEACLDTPPATAYWSYWHATRGGDWEESTLGAGSYVPPPGSVEGWSFGGAEPPAMEPPPPVPSTTSSTSRPTTTTTTTRPTTTTTRATTTSSSTTTSTVPIVAPTTAADTTTTETSTTTTEPIPTTSSAPTTTLAESSTTISLESASTPLVVAAPDDGGVDVLGIVMSIVAVLGVAAGAGWAVLRRRERSP